MYESAQICRLSAIWRITGIPKRTLRYYCEMGKIREARRTTGGQWRIQFPLSMRTRNLFTRLARPGLFKGEVGKPIGVEHWSQNFELWLDLMQLWPEDGETLDWEFLEQCFRPQGDEALDPSNPDVKRQLFARIMEKLPVAVLKAAMLWVIQEKQPPNLDSVAKVLGMTNRQMLYRSLVKLKIRKLDIQAAWAEVINEPRRYSKAEVQEILG